MKRLIVFVLLLILVAVVVGSPSAIAAKSVALAKRALNADKVDGLSASRTPKAGQLIALDKGKKLPASVLPVGVKGATGDQGSAGPQGPAGLQGPVGGRGDKGSQGDQGAQGSSGPAGARGAIGVGDQGIQGIDGPVGPTGPQGDAGITGSQGPQGQQGAQGPAGDRGVAGPDGPQGSQGQQGAQGPAGIQGPAGDQGVQGEQGLRGVDGPQGITGLDGPAGQQGDQGSQGPIGPIGLSGLHGQNGTNGEQGIQGPQGYQGIQGIQGEPGSAQTAEEIYTIISGYPVHTNQPLAPLALVSINADGTRNDAGTFIANLDQAPSISGSDDTVATSKTADKDYQLVFDLSPTSPQGFPTFDAQTEGLSVQVVGGSSPNYCSINAASASTINVVCVAALDVAARLQVTITRMSFHSYP